MTQNPADFVSGRSMIAPTFTPEICRRALAGPASFVGNVGDDVPSENLTSMGKFSAKYAASRAER